MADDPSLGGYSLFICAADRVTQTVLRYTTPDAHPTTSSSSSSSVTATSTTMGSSSHNPPPSSVSTMPTTPSSTRHAVMSPQSSSQYPTTTPAAPQQPSTPAWGIAGTVLGGVGTLTGFTYMATGGALVLLAAGYFIHRKWRNRRFRVKLQRLNDPEPSREGEHHEGDHRCILV
ncbi:hypothetical protein PCL_05152 [Purpureocillium lilacinum]|uniref:Uncharacterized protein n=1 Tax=Purpureocillium lilacinum TaxID=33203 RepID=A0A2U3DW51_PURLI|nr:hypothetical protein Purlil1_8795 [Purpureocillium lilacinum]PWI66454.1 hypothetical protein PCL_05152 [Purpureocillium lilacinum]